MEDFQDRVVRELAQIRTDVGEVKADVRAVKREQGRVILAAYESGYRDAGKDRRLDTPMHRRRRFKVIPGGASAFAFLLIAGGLLSYGLVSSRQPDTPEAVPGPTVTATATATATATETATVRPTATPDRPHRTGCTGCTGARVDTTQVSSVRRVEQDRPAGRRQVQPPPPVPEPRQARAGRDQDDRAETGTEAEPPPKPPAPKPTPRPIQSEPTTQSCVLRAELLGLDVSALCGS